jgi:hypothetical protein
MVSISIASKLVRIAVVTALVAGSLLIRPVTISAVNASLCGTPGYGNGAIPVVDSVSPNRGPFDGNTSITVTGCGFTARPGPGGQATVWFGSTVSGSVLVASDTQVTAIAPAHSLGTVDVTVVTGYGTSPIQPGDQYTYLGRLNQCGAVTLTAAPPYQTSSGTTVTFTANATGCWNPNPLYEFFIRPFDALVWTPVQAYSTNNVFQWDTSRQEPSYILVWAKDASSSTATFDVSATYQYMVTIALCSPVTLGAAPASPQKAGTHVTFTASTSCTNPNPLYEFWMRPALSSTWTMVRSYSTANQFEWDTTGLSGSYYIGVWVKDAASAESFDSNASVLYVVKPLTCTGVTLTATPQSPQNVGSQVTLTANASGCANPNPLYVFWIREASSTIWMPLSPAVQYPPDTPPYPVYTASNVFGWNTTGYAVGQYYLGVWAKDAASPASYDTYASIPFVLSSGSCGSVTISAVPASPQLSGTQVTFTASASACANANPLYEFWMRPASQTNWQLIQAYSTTGQYHWNSTGAAPGIVYFGVWAKDAGSGEAYDTNTSIPYTVTASSCASVTISAAPTSVVHSTSGGTHVTATAAATGCTNSPRYEFWIRAASSSTWQMVQAYSPTPTYDWNSTGAGTGTVYIGVHVRDANSTAGYDVVASTPVTVT